MKINFRKVPRKFTVGTDNDIEIKDIGELELEKDELITFVKNKKRYDIVCKEWGFYATPSINSRLKKEGFKTALIKNKNDQIYLMLVEESKQDLFVNYCEKEDQSIIKWLDEFPTHSQNESNIKLVCDCDHKQKTTTFRYLKPPLGETDFGIPDNIYKREYKCCKLCGHWFSNTKIDLGDFYNEKYVESTYGNSIHEKFKKIINLPQNVSDNAQRIKRLKSFANEFFKKETSIKVFDIGSGLGVFPYAVKKIGWHCTALDPDYNSAKHLEEKLEIKTINADFFDIKVKERFNIITLNKVLEHVPDPVRMLKRAYQFLNDEGFIYIEVPDAESASKDGPNREEFYIEHYHVFSLMSLNLMSKSANLNPIKILRIKEPSNKYSLVAFLIKN